MLVEDAVFPGFHLQNPKPAGLGQGPGGSHVIPINQQSLVASKSGVMPTETFDFWNKGC